MYNITYCRVP